MTLLVCVLVLLLCCSAFFSSSETALFSLSSMKVKGFKQSRDHTKKRIALLLSKPGDLIVSILIMNITVNILVQNVVSSIFGAYSHWALSVGVPLALTLVCGEVVPKSFGYANNEKIATAVAPVLRPLMKILYPIRVTLVALTRVISRVMFFFLRKEQEISVPELEHTLKASRQYGLLGEEEAELARGFLRLQESLVKEQMRPREEILFFDIEEPLSKLIHLFVDQECSRIPITQGGLDNILGVMTARLFFLYRPQLQESRDLIPVLQKPFFVPESMSTESLLRKLYDKRLSIAIVVDEYGSVSGLVALEDLVEIVVGEIADRRDIKSRYTHAGKDVIIASGKLELLEIERLFDVELHSENNQVTIGGWLTENLGDIPKSGTKFNTETLFFHVLAADPNRVRRVYIKRLRSL
jgi:putative hemolysin